MTKGCQMKFDCEKSSKKAMSNIVSVCPDNIAEASKFSDFF